LEQVTEEESDMLTIIMKALFGDPDGGYVLTGISHSARDE
jgi:hypothetical protein